MIRCVFYLRLSREDGTGESNSIQNASAAVFGGPGGHDLCGGMGG